MVPNFSYWPHLSERPKYLGYIWLNPSLHWDSIDGSPGYGKFIINSRRHRHLAVKGDRETITVIQTYVLKILVWPLLIKRSKKPC